MSTETQQEHRAEQVEAWRAYCRMRCGKWANGCTQSPAECAVEAAADRALHARRDGDRAGGGRG